MSNPRKKQRAKGTSHDQVGARRKRRDEEIERINLAGEELGALGLAEVVRDAAGNPIAFKITADGEALGYASGWTQATSCDRRSRGPSPGCDTCGTRMMIC